MARLFWQRIQTPTFRDYINKVTLDLDESEVDKAVLIALEGTPLSAGNRMIVELCRTNKNFLYGMAR